MMRKLKDKPLTQEVVEDNGCQHYWMIEAANGPSSMGTCSRCGESREFMNSMPSLNPLRRGPAAKPAANPNPFELPEMEGVELEADSKS
jgi:hypothetical protein